LKWLSLPEKDALYLNVTPDKNDGVGVYKLNVRDVLVDGPNTDRKRGQIQSANFPGYQSAVPASTCPVSAPM